MDIRLSTLGTVTRDKAAAVFWPESDTEWARANLSQTLYELKQELGEGWVEKRGNLLLTGDSLRVDTRAFTEHLEGGRHQDAAKLYRGPFLDGASLAQTHPFEEWVEDTRGHFRRLHREVLEGFIDLCRGRGALPRALAAASGFVGLDPLCETAQHDLILLLAESGNRESTVAPAGVATAPVPGDPIVASPGIRFQDRAPALKILVAVKGLAPELSADEGARLRAGPPSQGGRTIEPRGGPLRDAGGGVGPGVGPPGRDRPPGRPARQHPPGGGNREEPPGGFRHRRSA